MRNLVGVSLALILCLPLWSEAQEGSAAGNIYNQLQIMQEEIRDLRGMVEELNYELQRLKQRQIDDYQDLDSRMSSGAAPAPRASAPAPVVDPILAAAQGGAAIDASAGVESPATSSAPADSGAELASYTAAYDLLKNRQIDQAVTAFDAHLQRFPQGQYAANAHYWLGEIYLLQNNLGSAEKAFATVVNSFAADRKAPDAMFKLGRVYHLKGDKAKAKAMLDRAAATTSSAAALARAYLQDHF